MCPRNHGCSANCLPCVVNLDRGLRAAPVKTESLGPELQCPWLALSQPQGLSIALSQG